MGPTTIVGGQGARDDVHDEIAQFAIQLLRGQHGDFDDDDNLSYDNGSMVEPFLSLIDVDEEDEESRPLPALSSSSPIRSQTDRRKATEALSPIPSSFDNGKKDTAITKMTMTPEDEDEYYYLATMQQGIRQEQPTPGTAASATFEESPRRVSVSPEDEEKKTCDRDESREGKVLSSSCSSSSSSSRRLGDSCRAPVDDDNSCSSSRVGGRTTVSLSPIQPLRPSLKFQDEERNYANTGIIANAQQRQSTSSSSFTFEYRDSLRRFLRCMSRSERSRADVLSDLQRRSFIASYFGTDDCYPTHFDRASGDCFSVWCCKCEIESPRNEDTVGVKGGSRRRCSCPCRIYRRRSSSLQSAEFRASRRSLRASLRRELVEAERTAGEFAYDDDEDDQYGDDSEFDYYAML